MIGWLRNVKKRMQKKKMKTQYKVKKYFKMAKFLMKQKKTIEFCSFYLRTHVGSSFGDQSPVAWQKRSDLPTNSYPSLQW